jgi:GNAT superfamily N-acetyltransferase
MIRPAATADREAIWDVLQPVIRAGETYALPRDMSREAALAYWFSAGHEVFVAQEHGAILGTYFLRPNPEHAGGRVANCAYMTAAPAAGRGVATAMCEHSLAHARRRGFDAMQFNCVVSTNRRAVDLWLRLGFSIVETRSNAFVHPRLGSVDAFVLFLRL